MGRRPGSTTKSGRFMNPADQERKSMRQKELKRNKKQRTLVRQAILKSKDIDEIIDNLSRIDDQELDINVEHHSKYVFNEKRAKFMQTYNEVVNLYKQEKREDKVKELETKMLAYQNERARKVQQFNALRFSLEANPIEIPLPDGSSVPNAAMTPSVPAIPSQYLMPQARAGILKRTRPRDEHERTVPPGPPCGIPPPWEEGEPTVYAPRPTKRKVRFGDSETKLINDANEQPADDDYGPVDIPAEVSLTAADEDQSGESGSASAPSAPPQPLLRAPPLPPNMLPPPPRIPLRMPLPPPHFSRINMPPMTYVRPPAGDSVISAEPVVRRPSEREAASETKRDKEDAIITAEPKLRDLTKEVTKFVPTALRVQRNKSRPKRPISKYNMMGVQIESAQRKEAKDTDEAYADFMKEMSSLL